MSTENTAPAAPSNFIKAIIEDDLKTDKWGGRVHTRFPPEPNGYLHIGHAKSICLNFGVARDYGGKCNLRFDDTNPLKEDVEYVDSIQEDVRWLGFDWDGRCFYASDYFERIFECAVALIRKGLAYVDSLSAEDIRAYRGTLKEPGRNSPYRDRSIEENLDLFMRMRAGEFPDGAHVLRAKIDMKSPNVVMRDPTLYRIRHAAHHRTGDAWRIYPMYDFTHCLSDSFEGITHSICTLEFENNRELYDWVLDALGMYHPRQYEFARLNMTGVVLSKRKLIKLVEEGVVDGWDDPRMPTICGFRRKGFTPESIRDFCERIGVARSNNLVDYALLEHCLREDLNARAPRVMGVLKPLKLTIVNYPEDQTEEFEFPFHPENEAMGSRKLPFCRDLYIERTDFLENAPKKWFRLAPGMEVRLRYAYYVRCVEVVKDASGEVVEVRCEYDPATKGGWSNDGRKVKGTLHWLSARHAVPAEFRLFEHLFLTGGAAANVDDPEAAAASLNPNSLETLRGFVEPGLADAEPGWRCQFERTGYFVADTKLTRPGAPVFNRTTGLRDSFAKELQKG